MLDDDYRIVECSKWKLKVPNNLLPTSPVVVIPTIHPRGDQRVTRCAQVALNNGFRIHFIWEGEGAAILDSSISEELLPPSNSFFARIKKLPALYKIAIKSGSNFWHIHDFYMLPFAYLAKKLKGVRTIYDVHEYYPEYYASKVPKIIRNSCKLFISWFQVCMTKKIGGANVVAEKISLDFVRNGIPIAVSPNFPIIDHSSGETENRFIPREGVIHIGSLSDSYGMRIILDIGEELYRIGSNVQIDVVRRFPNSMTEARFHSLLRDSMAKNNLRIIDPVPAHAVASLLSQYRVGLSTIRGTGQNDLAVPTKLYEYTLAGLYVIGTNRPAQRNFLTRWGRFELFEETQCTNMAESIVQICESQFEPMSRADRISACQELSWSKAPSNSLEALMTKIYRV